MKKTVGVGGYTRDADGIYLIVDVSVQNNRGGTVPLYKSDFKLIDSQGRTYDYNDDGSYYLNGKSFIEKDLGAGLTTQLEVIFDIPQDDNGLELEVTNGIFSQIKKISIQ